MTHLTGNWKLDPAHSDVGFVVRHAGISKVRGKFSTVDATVTHDGDAATVEAVAQAASFDSGNADRDAHVRGADFLDVEKFPTVEFKGKLEGDELSGDLTIHGVTRPVTFDVELTDEVVDPFGQTRVGAEARATINRKDFGLTWNAALEAGGVLVSDKVQLTLDLAFVKQA